MPLVKDENSTFIKTGNLLLENKFRPILHQIAHCFHNFFISCNKWRHPLTFHDKEQLARILVSSKNYNFPGVLFVAVENCGNKCSQYVSELNKKFPVKGERKCSNSMLLMKL